MKNRVLFVLQASLLLAIAASHAYALSNDLYWFFPILNRAIHFAGGVWVALVSVWLFALQGRPVRILPILASVVFVSIGWEIFEVAIGMTNESNYVLDTVLDLCMDVLGGLVGFFAARFMVQSFTHGETAQDNSS